MKYFISLILIPTLLSAQMKEDIFEDIDMKTIFDESKEPSVEDITVSRETMVYYYALVKKNQSLRLRDKTKSTSQYIYHRGQFDAYNDILEYITKE